jgi:peptide-methionine (R)-S-oxide reductase
MKEKSKWRQAIDIPISASRRRFIGSGLFIGGGLFATNVLLTNGLLSGRALAAVPAEAKRSATVTIENFSSDGKSAGTVEVARIVKSDAEWRAQLSSAAYDVTRREGTERPNSGEYVNNHAAGLYRCICCDTALFNAKTKFESGTGWPSFWQPISKVNVAEIQDSSLGMRRVAVACKRCAAHLGHVFDDGPPPTGLRYCMNSVALHFVALA